jgi:uncharacterized membrane protein YphA (DoxX/SURF4 family)
VSLQSSADRWWLAARNRRGLHVFTWIIRVLLAIAFLPSGFTKLIGHRFTLLPIDTPIGFFFEALYRTGWYWQFLGLTQLLAAILILVPRLRAIGALMYFSIVLNIFLITVSLGFHGTPYITGLMLLGSIYLVCWHYDAWRGLLFRPAAFGASLQ